MLVNEDAETFNLFIDAACVLKLIAKINVLEIKAVMRLEG